MARINYGTTLWGEAFLKAIERETDSGRLSRGKSYANTGKVYDVHLKEKQINAKVRGNYQPFYQTSLSFTPFVKGDKQFIIEHIDKNPLLLADIINAKLAPELLQFLQKNEIDLFHGFSMSCSCPDFYGDYACKHIAGLYFILVNEIDKNPFILFSLRGLDLIKQYNIEKDLVIPYPVNIKYLENETQILPFDNRDNFRLLQFTNQKDFILSLLECNPPFAPIDYKEVLEEFYKKTAKELPLIIFSLHNEDIQKCQRVLQESEISIALSDDIAESTFKLTSELFNSPDVQILFKPFVESHKDMSVTITPIELFRLFISFEDDQGSDMYHYLFYLFRVVYILVQKNAFIPSVYESKGFFKIFYKPLFSLEIIKTQIDYLTSIAPLMASFNKKSLTQKSQTELLLTTTITDLIPYFNFMHKKQKNNPPAISYTFFHAQKYKVINFEDTHLALTVKNYFAIFEIIQSEYKYKLFIDKNEESSKTEYSLKLKVQEQHSQIEYTLEKSLEYFNKMQMIKFISFLRIFLPQIETLLQKESIILAQDVLEEFLLRTATIITNLGVDVILPKELNNLLKPKLSLKVSKGSKTLQSFFTMDSMLEYDWQIAIGDEMISVSEFEKLLQNANELIAFKDNFVVISAEEAKALFAQINRKTKLNKFDILQAKLSGEAEFDIDLDAFFKEMLHVKNIATPISLKANLREYQQRGFEWSINNLLNGFGTILADDMGLGKTIQTITILLYLIENSYIKKRVVIIVPTTLLSNWEKELEKFAPSLSFFSYYGAKRKLQESDIVLTSYDIARRDSDILKKMGIDCLIIDEAQKIKNSDTVIAKTLKSFKVKYKIALSGTPVENNLSELWSLFDFTLPKYLKSLKEFTKNYAQDIEIHKDRAKIEKLKQITAPFMLRRLKTDKTIINDLPDKIVVDEYATMTKEQASLYKSVVNESMQRLEEGDAKGLIFKLIISLKQICNHPRNFDKTSLMKKELSGKTELLMTLLDTILQKDEKVLIFTQYVEMGDILAKLIQKELYTVPLFLQGSMSKKKREETVEKFQSDSSAKIFILSLKAGGTGLNLTAANHVIHYDLWFNPAVENQATDRAFRIGQTKKVTVHRFITKNSFEEKIDKMIQAKKELSDLSVNIGESWLKDMDIDEIKNVFQG